MTYQNSNDKVLDGSFTKGVAKLPERTPMGQEYPLPLSYPEQDIIDTLPPKNLCSIPRVRHFNSIKKNTKMRKGNR